MKGRTWSLPRLAGAELLEGRDDARPGAPANIAQFLRDVLLPAFQSARTRCQPRAYMLVLASDAVVNALRKAGTPFTRKRRKETQVPPSVWFVDMTLDVSERFLGHVADDTAPSICKTVEIGKNGSGNKTN